jgi:hypothetical protein
MTVSVQVPLNRSTANGVTTVFAYDFHLLAADDLDVYLDDALADPSSYSVSGVGVVTGGSITFLTAPASGVIVTRQRNIDLHRIVDYQNAGDFHADTVDADFDRIWMVLQSLNYLYQRSLHVRIDDSTSFSDLELPLAPARSGLYLAFDALGKPTAASGTGADSALRTDLASQSGGVSLVFGTREKLYNSRTYYVRTDGSDSNNGLTNTTGGAFLSLQAAVDTVKNKIDLNGHDVTIQVASGTYTGGVIASGAWLGKGNVYIFGDTVTPSNCLVSTTSADCFRAEKGAAITVRGFKVRTTTSGIGLVAYTGGFISTQSMDFGACAGAHIEAGTGGVVLPDGNYTITGNADSHWHVGSEGMISCGTITITNASTPTFTSYFAGCAEGSISCGSVTFTSASAFGPFYLAHKNGTIDIGANNQASFLPGSISGTCNTGGIIATTNRNWTPVLSFSTPGNLTVTYAVQKGTWSRVGDYTYYTCDIQTSSFTHTTASGPLLVSGLPFNAKNVTNVNHLGATYWQGITKAGYTQVGVQLPANATVFAFPAFGSAQAVSNVSAADMPTGGSVVIRFSILVLSATAD